MGLQGLESSRYMLGTRVSARGHQDRALTAASDQVSPPEAIRLDLPVGVRAGGRPRDAPAGSSERSQGASPLPGHRRERHRGVSRIRPTSARDQLPGRPPRSLRLPTVRLSKRPRGHFMVVPSLGYSALHDEDHRGGLHDRGHEQQDSHKHVYARRTLQPFPVAPARGFSSPHSGDAGTPRPARRPPAWPGRSPALRRLS